MALTTYNITGNLEDALGAKALLGEVTFMPAGTTEDARVDGADAMLGPIRYSIADLPSPMALTEGAWVIAIRPTGRVNGEAQFRTKTIPWNMTAATTWGAIVASAAAPVPLPAPTFDESVAGVVGTGGQTDTALAAEMERLVDDPASLPGAALRETFVSRAVTLADLPSPAYAAHMGGSLVYPEETMEAFTASAALGVDALELDCHLTADGALVVMHDPTIDRTTTGTGLVTDQLSAAWPFLNVDAGAWLASGYPSDLHPPFAEDVFREFGNRKVLIVEAKGNSTAGPIAALIQTHSLVNSCIVQAASLANLGPARDLGVQTMLITNTPDAATILAAGTEWVTMDAGLVTEADVSTAVAAGLRVCVHGVNRHYDRDRFTAAGAEILMTDDPSYVMDKGKRTSDLFQHQVWMPGQILGANSRGQFVAPDRWGFQTPGTRTALGGFLAPITATTYTLEFDLTFDKLAATVSRYAYVHICEPDDRAYYANDSSRGYADGYEIRFQQQGYVNVNKTVRSPASSTGIAPGTVAMGTGAATAGETHHYKIVVSPTQVVISRTGAGSNTNTYTVTDSAFRGGYLHFGKFDASDDLRVSFSNVTVV